MSVEQLAKIAREHKIPIKPSTLTDLVEPIKSKTNKREVEWPLPSIPFFVIMSGRPESGKTNLWLNFLKHKEMYYQKFERVFLYSSTKHTIDKKTLKLSDKRIFNKLDIDHFVENAFKKQEQLQSEVYNTSTVEMDLYPEDPDGYCKATVRHHKPSPVHQLFILDDVVNDIHANLYHILTAILNRRHFNISIIVCTQKYNLLDLSLRIASSGVFFWHTNNLKEIESFREELVQLPQKTFYMMLNQVWSKPKQFLFFKQDDPKSHMFPFFAGFNQLQICNVNTRLMTDGSMPEAPQNIIAAQKEMGLVAGDSESNFHENTQDEKTTFKRKPGRPRTRDLKPKRPPGRPKGSKNKRRAWYVDQHGVVNMDKEDTNRPAAQVFSYRLMRQQPNGL